MIESLVEDRDGWCWPKDDVNTWAFLLKHFDLPQQISNHVSNKRVVVQAGGNCGLYPKQYGKLFDTVYTFEPDWLNFYCLVRNCPDDNIIKAQACLGDGPGLLVVEIFVHLCSNRRLEEPPGRRRVPRPAPRCPQ